MNERMDDGKFSGLWQRATQGGADRHDAYALAQEAERARREEAQQQDRIRALEVQQAELLRQAMELTEENQLLRDALAGVHNGNLDLSTTVVELEDTKAELLRQVKEGQMQANLLAWMLGRLVEQVSDGRSGDILRRQAREMLEAYRKTPKP